MRKLTNKSKYSIDPDYPHIATIFLRRKSTGKWAAFAKCHSATIELIKKDKSLEKYYSLMKVC